MTTVYVVELQNYDIEEGWASCVMSDFDKALTYVMDRIEFKEQANSVPLALVTILGKKTTMSKQDVARHLQKFKEILVDATEYRISEFVVDKKREEEVISKTSDKKREEE